MPVLPQRRGWLARQETPMTHAFRILTPDAQYADDGGIERATAGSGFHFDILREWEPARIPAELFADADALLVWHEMPIDRELISHLKRCRIIVRAGVGFDHIDIAAADVAGIPVCNTPDYGTSEVADHAIGMLLALRRGLTFYNSQLHQDPVSNFTWAGAPLIARVRGTRLGVVGLGRIGTATALRAQSFGIDVIAYDPYLPNGQEIALGVTRVDSLKALLEQVDAVTLHAPLTPETKHLINADTLQFMLPHAVLINTARGDLIDADALCDALTNAYLAGAALDVLAAEPPHPDDPLVAALRSNDTRLRQRLLLTPHAAWYSHESQSDARRLSVETVVAYLRDRRLRNCVNQFARHERAQTLRDERTAELGRKT